MREGECMCGDSGGPLVVVLPHGPKVLSANASVPKTARGVMAAARKKQRAKKTARELAWALTLKALDGRVLKPNRYVIRWYYKYGEAPDDDNTTARCKAYLDGAASALKVNDRELRLCGVDRVKDRVRFREMELVFWREEGSVSLFPGIPAAVFPAVSLSVSDEHSGGNGRGFLNENV